MPKTRQRKLSFSVAKPRAAPEASLKKESKPNRAATDELLAHRIADQIEKLNQFDLNLRFGPCVGITRLERWNRADKFGKKPPREILDIINRYPDSELVQQGLWFRELKDC